MSWKAFDDRTTTTDLNGPNIEVKTDAYLHEPGSTTTQTTVNPFGDSNGRTGGSISVTGVGTASWPVGYATYASNTGTIGYQWYGINEGKLGLSTTWSGQTTDTLTFNYLNNPDDNLKQYYCVTSVIPSAYAQPDGTTVVAGTARSTGYAINKSVETSRVTLSVLPELTLNTQPTDQSATVNNTAKFATEASVTDNTPISYQWYVDGNLVTDGDIISEGKESIRKERYAVNTSNGRDNSIVIPDDATNVKIRIIIT